MYTLWVAWLQLRESKYPYPTGYLFVVIPAQAGIYF